MRPSAVRGGLGRQPDGDPSIGTSVTGGSAAASDTSGPASTTRPRTSRTTTSTRETSVSVTVMGDVFLGDVRRLSGRVAYTHFTTDERGGVEGFREGDELDWVKPGVASRALVGGRAGAGHLSLQGGASQRRGAGRRGTREQRGNEIRGLVTVGYIIDDVWSSGASWTSGTWPPTTTREQRCTTAAGPRWPSDPPSPGSHGRFGIETGLRYFFMDVERIPVLSAAGTIDGVHADLRVMYRFELATRRSCESHRAGDGLGASRRASW